MSQYQPMHDESTALLLALPEQLKGASETTITTCTNRIQNDITKDLKALQVNLVKALRDNIKKEVRLFVCLLNCQKLLKNNIFRFKKDLKIIQLV